MFFSVFGYLKLMLLISTDAFISSIFITSLKMTNGYLSSILTRFFTTPVVANLLFLPNSNATTTLWDIVVMAIERIVFITYFVITLMVLSTVKISASYSHCFNRTIKLHIEYYVGTASTPITVILQCHVTA